MDAFVQLALIEKAKRIFATGSEVMLSFPLLSPIAFTAEELNGLAAPQTSADYAAAADFARTVNFIPRDIVASASERMLWDVYRDVLARAEVATAQGGETGGDGASRDLLYVASDDGSRVESEALKTYRQYRDAWILSNEDYAARKLSGELSDDPAVREQWAQVEEPALRAALETAKSQWETIGRRPQIEHALAVERQAALRNPGLRWAEWNAFFNPDIDLITEAGGIQYAPTGFSPRNFAEQEGWLSFELSASEIAALVEAAPEALKAVLGGGQTAVEKVSFEYRSVALVRPWFRPEAMTSRIWRSADPDLLLSDGGSPAAGACPAYATACVFVRNLVVVSGGAAQLAPLNTGLFTLNAHQFTNRAITADPSLLARLVRQKEGLAAPEAPQPVSMRAFRAIDLNSVVALRRADFAVLHRAEPEETGEEVTARTRLRRRADLFRVPFRRHRFEHITLPTPTPTPASPPPTPPPPRDEISVLAFICKQLPKAPDPAPDLTFS